MKYEPIEPKRGRRPALSPDEVQQVRRAYLKGATIEDLSKRWGVSEPTISDAIKGARAYKEKEGEA